MKTKKKFNNELISISSLSNFYIYLRIEYNLHFYEKTHQEIHTVAFYNLSNFSVTTASLLILKRFYTYFITSFIVLLTNYDTDLNVINVRMLYCGLEQSSILPSKLFQANQNTSIASLKVQDNEHPTVTTNYGNTKTQALYDTSWFPTYYRQGLT